MSGNSDLHAVIHTLTPQESSKFRKSLTTKKLQLFDALLAMPTYDHDALEKAMAPMPRNQLAPNKAQLLDTLLAAHRQDTVHSQYHTFHEITREAHFLMSRGHLGIARKRLRPALQNALENEEFHIALDIISLDKELCAELRLSGTPLAFPETSPDQEAHIFAQTQDLLACKALNNKAIAIVSSFSHDRIQQAQNLAHDIQAYPEPLSTSARIDLSRAASTTFNLLGDGKSLLAFVKLGIEAIENLPAHNYSTHIQSLHAKLLFNYTSFSSELGKVQEAKWATEKLSALCLNSNLALYSKHKAKAYLLSLRIVEAIKILEPETSKILMTECKSVHHSPYPDKKHLISVKYLCACLCFYHGWHKDAGQYLMHIINHYSSADHPRIYTMAHFLYMFNSLERSDFDHVEYYAPRVQRLLSGNDFLSEYERELCAFFNSCTKLESQAQLQTYYKLLQDALEGTTSDPLSTPFRHLFELDSFIQARLEGDSLLERIRIKYKAPD